jgi:hypothetical protein
MAIPGGLPTLTRGERRRHVSALLRRAIGFQITFGGEQPTGNK